MRVLKEFLTKNGKISIFSFNEKWIVKCELGLCEQTYKFPHEEFELKNVEEFCQNSDFQSGLGERFATMHAAMKAPASEQ